MSNNRLVTLFQIVFLSLTYCQRPRHKHQQGKNTLYRLLQPNPVRTKNTHKSLQQCIRHPPDLHPSSENWTLSDLLSWKLHQQVRHGRPIGQWKCGQQEVPGYVCNCSSPYWETQKLGHVWVCVSLQWFCVSLYWICVSLQCVCVSLQMFCVSLLWFCVVFTDVLCLFPVVLFVVQGVLGPWGAEES